MIGQSTMCDSKPHLVTKTNLEENMTFVKQINKDLIQAFLGLKICAYNNYVKKYIFNTLYYKNNICIRFVNRKI